MTIADTLSKLVIASAQCYSDHYDKKAADEAEAQSIAEKAADPTNIYAGMVDYKKFYRLSHRQACYKACTDAGHPRLAEPVYLMLSSWWNDTLDWAEAVEKNNVKYFEQNAEDTKGLPQETVEG